MTLQGISGAIMELLLFGKNHWLTLAKLNALKDRIDLDTIDPVQREILKAQITEKYASRYQLGDIVEVRPDGYWTVEKGWNRKAFYLIAVPGLKYDEKYQKALEDTDGSLLRRRKWRIDPADVPAVARQKLIDNRELTVTKLQFATFVKENVRG